MSNNKIVWGKPPSDNISLDDCEWYHIMEIPGVGLTDGYFDVREDISNIFGNLGQHCIQMPCNIQNIRLQTTTNIYKRV